MLWLLWFAGVCVCVCFGGPCCNGVPAGLLEPRLACTHSNMQAHTPNSRDEADATRAKLVRGLHGASLVVLFPRCLWR